MSAESNNKSWSQKGKTERLLFISQIVAGISTIIYAIWAVWAYILVPLFAPNPLWIESEKNQFRLPTNFEARLENELEKSPNDQNKDLMELKSAVDSFGSLHQVEEYFFVTISNRSVRQIDDLDLLFDATLLIETEKQDGKQSLVVAKNRFTIDLLRSKETIKLRIWSKDESAFLFDGISCTYEGRQQEVLPPSINLKTVALVILSMPILFLVLMVFIAWLLHKFELRENTASASKS